MPPRGAACSSPRKALKSGLFGTLLALAWWLAAALGAVPAAAAGSLGALQADLSRQLEIAGPGSSGYVYDLSAGQALFSVRATALRPPASVEKLYTATTALERFGSAAQLQTTVFGAGHLLPGGVWEGSLYLRGGGDPTFGSSAFIRARYGGVGARVSALAAQLARQEGIRRVTGSIEGDESLFDSLRGEPSSSFAPDPFLEGTLSGLAFNRGASGAGAGGRAPGAFAARQLRAALKADGVRIAGQSGAADTPAGAVALAQVPSPTISQLLGLMLPPSDNFFAETLLKDLGARFAGAGTTAAGAGVVSQTVASLLGIHPRVVDGSGLSPADKTSVYQVADLLVRLAPTPLGPLLRGDLAVAGRTGTLAHRMRGTVAAGRCRGKTGTLSGVSNLVGYCRSAGGHELAFAIFNDGIATASAHVLQDHMVISLAGSRIASAELAAAARVRPAPPARRG